MQAVESKYIARSLSIRYRTKFYPRGYDRRGRLDCSQIFLYFFHKSPGSSVHCFVRSGRLYGNQAEGNHNRLGQFMLDFERSWQGSLFKILEMKVHGNEVVVNLPFIGPTGSYCDVMRTGASLHPSHAR